MKWGVRQKIANTVKARQRKVNKRYNEVADKYHEKNKNKKVYKKHYQRNLKIARGNHRRAVMNTRSEIRNVKMAIAFSVASIASSKNARIGAAGLASLSGVAYRKVASPENIRRGKNVILAMKKSPVRYADVSKYKDIIDM